MEKIIIRAITSKVIPALAGAAGAWLLTSFPAVYAAVCTGAL